MDPKALHKKMKQLVNEEARVRKQLSAYIREIDRRGLWRQLGFKSLKQFCLEKLGYDETELRPLLIASGVVVTANEMKSPIPSVQKRIEALRSWRRSKSTTMDVAPYLIMTNRTLLEIANSNPQNVDDLAKIRGMGERRIASYGKEVLRCLN